ncbi:MAG TPA: hypothetical protein DEA55_07820 [Rhodospirillaceae bacterium]|nr:hypothetical protein [Rhodospirillaceae bacterium]
MGALPHELDRYFTRTAKTIEVPLGVLIPQDPEDEERVKRIGRAEGYMSAAFNGKMDKRKPLTVVPRGDGTYDIRYGSSTYAVAKANNWPTILVESVEP